MREVFRNVLQGMEMTQGKTVKRNLLQFQKKLEERGDLMFIEELAKEHPQAGVYLVGGMVRDALMRRSNHEDIDVVISGVPARRLERFLATMGKVSLVGKTFGVFKFLPEGVDPKNQIDVALPRREHSLVPGGYRDFEIQSDSDLPIEEDLSRRDFTVNAMAWSWRTAQLIDPFGGLQDIERKHVRAVGDPTERFREDYSRVLRALRFSCQLGFEIEPKTWDAVRECMPRMNDSRLDRPSERVVPFEVVANELLKAFVSDPARAFDLYEESCGFEPLMPEVLDMKGCPQPEMFHAEGDVWTHTRMALQSLTSDAFRQRFEDEPIGAELVMAVLFHDIGKPYTIRTPEEDGVDRIRFDKHDAVGAGLAKTICTRLKLSSPPREDPLHVDPDNVWWLVKTHLLGIRSDVEYMKNSTVEKYFLKDEPLGRKLLKLIYADGLATISPDGKPTVSNYFKLQDRVERLKEMRKDRQAFEPILSGHEIMEAFNLKPGRRIGELLALLREEQLAGRIQRKEEALVFLRRHIL